MSLSGSVAASSFKLGMSGGGSTLLSVWPQNHLSQTASVPLSPVSNASGTQFVSSSSPSESCGLASDPAAMEPNDARARENNSMPGGKKYRASAQARTRARGAGADSLLKHRMLHIYAINKRQRT